MGQTLVMIVAELDEALKDVSAEDCPIVLGELERLKARTWSRLMVTPSEQDRHEKLLTAEEVATVLSIPASCAYELIRKGKIRGKKIGKYVRVDPTAVDEYKARLG